MCGEVATYYYKMEGTISMVQPSIELIRWYKRDTILRLEQLTGFRTSSEKRRKDGSLTEDVCFQHFLREQDAFRKAIGVAKKSVKESVFKGFVNYKPTTEEFNDFAQWDVEDEELFLAASTIVAEGYKLSTSFDKTKGTFVATLYCNDAENHNGGWALSAFAPSWYDSLRLVVYKHEVIFHGQWLLPVKGGGGEQWG